MATVNKDFKIKSGLIVEGTTGTINGYNILTESQDSVDFIIDVIGGETLITSVEATQLEVINGELNVKSGVFDAAGAADTAEDNAIAAAALDATSKADAAQSAAETFATNADTTLYGTVTSDIATAKSEAGVIAQGYADTAESDAIAAAALDATSKADAAQSAAETFATNADTTLYGTVTSDIATAKSEAITAAEGYTNTAVANLVDSAPALLDTLNELAAAINDDANFASTIGTSIGEKVAKSGDTMTGELVLAADPTQALAAATKQYVDSAASDAYNDAIATADGTAQTYANTAEQNAKTYADGLAVNYDAAGAASTAETNANTYTDNSINALDTDDIEEGSTNQYFTDSRAKSSAADLLTGASLTNITITGTGAGLTITAENGVADSTTDDLAEGDNNLYFTDERAIDAVSNADIYPNAVIIDNVAKQVASQITAATAGIQVGHAFAKADYRSAEFLVKVAYGTHTEISKVLLTLDTSDNIAITEYGIVGTNGSASTISADISGTDVRLLVTTANNDSTVTVIGTLLI
jgi:hypothetical protein